MFDYCPDDLFPGPNIEAELEKLSARYPKRAGHADRKEASIASPLAALPDVVPSPSEIERYNQERDVYLRKYAEYLRTRWEYENELFLTIPLRIYLVNRGSAPAEDVDILAHFPDGTMPRRLGKRPEAVEPTPPRPPRSALQMQLDNVMTVPFQVPDYMDVLPSIIGVVDRGPRIRRVDSYEVEWPSVSKLKHGMSIELEPITVWFESENAISSFTIEYRINAANLAEDEEGRLHVVVRRV